MMKSPVMLTFIFFETMEISKLWLVFTLLWTLARIITILFGNHILNRHRSAERTCNEFAIDTMFSSISFATDGLAFWLAF
jgi:hypothetical protein